jgi:hypothetical protein
MATVADTLKKIDNSAATSVSMYFELYGGPHCRTSYVTSRSRITVTTHATTGAFSTTLLEGIYRVRWRVSSEFNEVFLGVPNTSSTYAFHDIATTSPENIPNPAIAYFATLAELALVNTDASLLFIGADGNGETGWFETGSDDSGTEGVDWVTDLSGTRIWERRQ